jgi:cytochrome c-type biogenesis protein CcmH/NrfG
MMDTKRTLIEPWTAKRAILLAALCLMAGIVGGWLIRGAQAPAAVGPANTTIVAVPVAKIASPESAVPDPARLKEKADAKAAPLLERLKSDPNNPALLTGIGDIYYDAQQYSIAIDPYRRALKIKPSDAAVRTDMATAYWYLGDADTAIAEFNKALTYAPDNPNTLFNRGLVMWKGKNDGAGALADWQKLLAANPNYQQRDQVKEMMAEVKKQKAGNP